VVSGAFSFALIVDNPLQGCQGMIGLIRDEPKSLHDAGGSQSSKDIAGDFASVDQEWQSSRSRADSTWRSIFPALERIRFGSASGCEAENVFEKARPSA
jgi:hypothetical protein